ncbi:MAG TPA: 2-amino-4-hydroxy-6-hydroxymethyldihydropteridine diphosphokinase [Usitatibacter sp.]|nr:2-amino-4-hydroxy-6-hydroxymethyldihydropteridine diphosphokinase [Usitatibacter sp.]
MSPPVTAVVALGSNLDDPEAQVRRAFGEIAELPETWVTGRSALYRTAPVGYADQPAFVNACAKVETRLSARGLLDGLLGIEARHGRARGIPNGPRTLDLDIVLYGGATLDEPGLRIPHPRAHERAFVLAPLVDVWPEAAIPGKGPAKDILAAIGREGIQEIVVPVQTGTQLDSRLRGNDGK